MGTEIPQPNSFENRISLWQSGVGKLWPSKHFTVKNSLTSQGAPETGDIPGATHKPTTIEVKPESLEYAPTGGTKVWPFLDLPC